MTRTRYWSIFVVVLVFASCGKDAPNVVEPDPRCTVASIADGDTLTCVDGRRMRFLLIDTPEMAQVPYGEQARDVLFEISPPATVLNVEYDVERKDRFDRDLTYLFLANGTMVNEEIVRRGYAVMLVFAPNGKYRDRIQAALDDARANARGLWADWAFACLPRDFRADRCT